MSKKNSERGESKVYYDKTNYVAVAQWYNNKVDTVVSKIDINDKVPLHQRKGLALLVLTTESCVRKYSLVWV